MKPPFFSKLRWSSQSTQKPHHDLMLTSYELFVGHYEFMMRFCVDWVRTGSNCLAKDKMVIQRKKNFASTTLIFIDPHRTIDRNCTYPHRITELKQRNKPPHPIKQKATKYKK